MQQAYKTTTPPAVEPVSVAEVSDHLRLPDATETADSAYITGLIQAARQFCENELSRRLITQTVTWVLDSWPREGRTGLGWWDGVREGSLTIPSARQLELPVGPVQSVTSMTSYASDNTPSVVDSSSYFVDTLGGRIVLNSGSSLPLPSRVANGLEIVFVVGYGDAATDVPMGLRQAVLQLVAHWYERREPIAMVMGYGFSSLPYHFDRMLRQYKVRRI